MADLKVMGNGGDGMVGDVCSNGVGQARVGEWVGAEG